MPINKKQPFILNSNKGISLIALLLVIGTISTSVLMYQFSARSSVTTEQFHKSRVKSMLAIVEGRVRALAFAPTSYQGCNTAIGITSCQLKVSVFDNLKMTVVPGCKPYGPSCGVEVKNISFDSTSQKFTADVSYNGKELPQRTKKPGDPPTVQLVVPADILQSQTYDCGTLTGGARPVFMGFNDRGNPDCRAFKACRPGQFAAAVETMTIDPVCIDIPSDTNCNANQYIRALNWRGGSSARPTCVPRQDPYSVWPVTQADPNNPSNPIPPATPVASNPPPAPTPPSPSGTGCVVNEYTWGAYCVAWAGTLPAGQSTYLTSRVGNGSAQLFCHGPSVEVMFANCN